MKPQETKEEEEESPEFMEELFSSPIIQQQVEEEEEDPLDLSPSFNSYSINRLADTAARVVTEFEGLNGGGDGDDDDDFEFVSLQKTEEHMIFDGSITPIFPIFNHEIHDLFVENEKASSIRFSLEKLLIDDRNPPSSSSSEAEELDGVPPGTYCVWKPKAAAAAEREKCKKSKSTGSSSGSSSSKRWRIRDLLRRSNSEGGGGGGGGEGKNSFVFLTPFPRSESTTKKKEEKTEKSGKKDAVGKKSTKETNSGVAGKSKVVVGGSSAHEVFYVRNRKRMMKEGDKRRSYLPYRQDLVGFWANINTMSKAFPPF